MVAIPVTVEVLYKLFIIITSNTAVPEFIIEPRDGTFVLNQSPSAKFDCKVISTSHIFRPYWIIVVKDPNSDTARYLSTQDEHDKAYLSQRGVLDHSDETTTNVTIPIVERNNGLEIYCAVFDDGVTEFSQPITIQIIGI